MSGIDPHRIGSIDQGKIQKVVAESSGLPPSSQVLSRYEDLVKDSLKSGDDDLPKELMLYCPPKSEDGHRGTRSAGKVAGPTQHWQEDDSTAISSLSFFDSSIAFRAPNGKEKVLSKMLRFMAKPFLSCEHALECIPDEGEIEIVMMDDNGNYTYDYDDDIRDLERDEVDDALDELEKIKRMGSWKSINSQETANTTCPTESSPVASEHQRSFPFAKQISASFQKLSTTNSLPNKNKSSNVHRKRAVSFDYPPVSSLKQYPCAAPEDIPNLFFSEEELNQAEEDRKAARSADDVECVHMSAEKWKRTLSKNKVPTLSTSPEAQPNALPPASQSQATPASAPAPRKTLPPRNVWSASPILRKKKDEEARTPPPPFLIDNGKKKNSIRSRLRSLVRGNSFSSQSVDKSDTAVRLESSILRRNIRSFGSTGRKERDMDKLPPRPDPKPAQPNSLSNQPEPPQQEVKAQVLVFLRQRSKSTDAGEDY